MWPGSAVLVPVGRCRSAGVSRQRRWRRSNGPRRRRTTLVRCGGWSKSERSRRQQSRRQPATGGGVPRCAPTSAWLTRSEPWRRWRACSSARSRSRGAKRLRWTCSAWCVGALRGDALPGCDWPRLGLGPRQRSGEAVVPDAPPCPSTRPAAPTTTGTLSESNVVAVPVGLRADTRGVVGTCSQLFRRRLR